MTPEQIAALYNITVAEAIELLEVCDASVETVHREDVYDEGFEDLVDDAEWQLELERYC